MNNERKTKIISYIVVTILITIIVFLVGLYIIQSDTINMLKQEYEVLDKQEDIKQEREKILDAESEIKKFHQKQSRYFGKTTIEELENLKSSELVEYIVYSDVQNTESMYRFDYKIKYNLEHLSKYEIVLELKEDIWYPLFINKDLVDNDSRYMELLDEKPDEYNVTK